MVCLNKLGQYMYYLCQVYLDLQTWRSLYFTPSNTAIFILMDVATVCGVELSIDQPDDRA